MAMNRIQFQPGLSLPAFHADFGSEAQCEAALERSRWPESFRCPYHAFYLAKYATRYLAASAYRFNRRFHLETLLSRLLVATLAIGPRPARWLRLAKKSL